MDSHPTRAMDGYGSEDMAIPEIKLVQNVGGIGAKEAGAKPGDFYCTITGEVIPGEQGFDIVVVDIPKTRTYWGRTEIDDDPPVCASADSQLNIQGEPCAQCPYDARCDTPWLLGPTERRTKCLLNYNVLAIDVRNDLPALIRTSGISTQAVRELLTGLRLNKKLRGEYHKAIIHVASQVKKTSSGDAFAMTLRVKGLIPEAKRAEELKSQSLQLLGVNLLPEGVTRDETPSETGVPETPPETPDILFQPDKTFEEFFGPDSPGAEPKAQTRTEAAPAATPAAPPSAPQSGTAEPIDVDF